MEEKNKLSDEELCDQMLDRMGLSRSLVLLSKMRDSARVLDLNDYVCAIDSVFNWIDEMVLLLKKIGDI